jgi:hypothetical protein
MTKTVMIIGDGNTGLSVGYYAQLNGFSTKKTLVLGGFKNAHRR